jgi:hypothetical protein
MWAEHNGRSYINGCLNWIDIYSNCSTENRGTWSAVSGPGRPFLPIGNHTILYGNMGLNTLIPGYIVDNADFYIDLFPNPHYEIHPDGNNGITSFFGTAGCIGLQETAENCLRLYKMVRRYTYCNCILPLFVNY